MASGRRRLGSLDRGARDAADRGLACDWQRRRRTSAHGRARDGADDGGDRSAERPCRQNTPVRPSGSAFSGAAPSHDFARCLRGGSRSASPAWTVCAVSDSARRSTHTWSSSSVRRRGLRRRRSADSRAQRRRADVVAASCTSVLNARRHRRRPLPRGRRGRRCRCARRAAGRSRGDVRATSDRTRASTSSQPPSRARCASTTGRWTSTRRKLPQGQHVVRVLLEDAAGNRTPIFGPVTRTITSSEAIGPGSDPALRGAANGDGASDLARLTAHWGQRGSRTLLVSRFGRRHVVRGRLRTTDGAPIANAAIDMVSKTTAVNARELAKRAGPKTGADGGWRVALPKGVSSRDVTFRYRSHVNDTIAAATASVRLRVQGRPAPGASIRAAPSRGRRSTSTAGCSAARCRAAASRSCCWRGRVAAGGCASTSCAPTAAGAFAPSTASARPAPTVYRFRALSLSEAAYPYSRGCGSNVVNGAQALTASRRQSRRRDLNP